MSAQKAKSVSVIIPAYNEVDCIDELVTRLIAVFNLEGDYEWEALIVENGSTDDTWSAIERMHSIDSRIKAVRLSRNFRMDGGLTAGLSFVSGDACIFMTADLQDPPEMISTFLRKWEEGFENVYGVVTNRHGVSPIRSFNSRLFYWIAGFLTDNQIPRNASDFRLLDRRVYKAVDRLKERNRFVRGLVAWVGFKSVGVPMERPPRHAGESKADTFKVIDLAFRGIFAHSLKPLRLITIVGFALSGISMLGLAVSVFLWVTRGVPFGGFGTIMSSLFLLFGVVTLMLGILSEYVGLIYEEVKQRPNFIVSETLGWE